VTLYARGYRPYEGPRDATRFAFVPIQREGTRIATKGRAFRVFFLISAAMLVLFTVLLYVGESFFGRQARMPGGFALPGDPEARAAAFLEGWVVGLQSATSGLGQILVLFVGAGLVADDVKARALPLYLVRPVTPVDYWIGKLLVPVRVLALTVLFPGLLLVLVGALFQPSDRMLPFLWGRRDLLAAVVLHFAHVALVWSSVALFVSTVAGSRVAAIVLGAVVFFAGGIPREVAPHAEGALARLLDAVDLHAGGRAVLASPLEQTAATMGRLPETAWAVGVGAAFVALGAFVVLRRARTVEVVS
jgi:hypothetical protein